MPIKLIRGQRVYYNKYDVDIEYRVSTGNAAIDNEDVPLLGAGTDYAGDYPGISSLDRAVPNKLWGTNGAVVGAKSYDLTARGNKTALNRTRYRLETLNLKE